MVKKEPAKPEARQDGRGLLVLEVVAVVVVMTGLALWSVAAALVVGGVLGVLACERAMAERRTDSVGGDGT
ncbi:hypothetical protein [Streptomyces zaomyceticus]|uniref:hypothetical protein n=1 Tax=Streptomyces zaomyceticus TaxID=68286 RepID=UPI0036A0F23C